MNSEKTKDSPPKIIGYARVSTFDQCLDLQINALEKYGCDKILCDVGVSGGIRPENREQFKLARAMLNKGDSFAVWKLDRLGRTLKGVINTVDSFSENGIHFISLTENILTNSATGRAFWQFIGLMAELERGLIRERTIEGMKAAKLRGVKIGRPRKLSDQNIQTARIAIQSGTSSIKDVAQKHNVSPSTVRRALAKF